MTWSLPRSEGHLTSLHGPGLGLRGVTPTPPLLAATPRCPPLSCQGEARALVGSCPYATWAALVTRATLEGVNKSYE